MNKNSRVRRAQISKASRTGSRDEISSNQRRNMKMIVVQGTDEKGLKFSRTFHIKIYPSKPSFPKPRRDTGYTPAQSGYKVQAAPIPGDAVEAIPEVV